jgi:signal transduction histidine kinase
MNALDLLALLVYTFGAYTYGAILFLSFTETESRGWAGQRRPSAAGEADITGLALMALGFIWFVTNLALTILAMGRLQPLWLQLTSIWLAFLYPPLIMHVTVAEHSARHRSAPPPSPLWRRAIGPAYVAMLCAPAWSTLVAGGAIDVDNAVINKTLSLSLGASFVIASIFSIAMSARRSQPATSARARLGHRAMTMMFAITVLLFVLLPAMAFGANQSLGAIAGRSLEVATKSLPLAFLFVGAYFESRFDFFDILLKRGLGLAATIAALAGFFALALPAIGRVPAGAAPWICAIAALPVLFALRWIQARIAAILDRWWLGRRYSTVDAVKYFIATLRSATSEQALGERAEQALASIFGAPAAISLAGDAGGTTAFDIVETVAFETAAGVRGTIAMGARASEAPYFSEDLALLASLADVFASLLDNLHLQARKQEQEQRAQELSLHASRSELRALRAQINPHFLFNALNAIAGLIHRNPASADRTIEQLADVFRYALRGAESEWVALDDELEFVRAYLEVERARFGDRLQVEIEQADGASGVQLPTMMVQTLVENAVKHGLSELRGAAIVEVRARVDGERVVIDVIDNGPGFGSSRAASPRSGGYGLANIRQRLHGYFGDDAALEVRRDADRELTMVSLVLPVVRHAPAPAVRQEARR